MRGERQADPVPAVHKDVGTVVRRLRQLGYAVDELHGSAEVGELPVTQYLLALATLGAALELIGDALVAQRFHGRNLRHGPPPGAS